MAKWFGEIGFDIQTETVPGVWKPVITPRNYYGDVLEWSRRIQGASEQVNDNITIADKISIVADPFARENFYTMKYVEYMGSKWKVTHVSVQYPRLILSVGDLYNG